MQSHPGQDHTEKSLSPRMAEILTCLAHGLTYAQSAAEMGISIHTAKSYAAKAFVRLGAKGRTQATAIAVARKLIEVV